MKKSLFVFVPFLFCIVIDTARAENAVSETDTHALSRLYNGDEMLGVKPVVGFNTYSNDQGGSSTRAAYGIGAELNLASPLGIDFTRWFIGPQTGLTYSHLGPSNANFFGANGAGNGGGANLAVIPVNLKVGIAPFSWMRAGLHGGANVIYRSIASSIQLDETDLNWRLVPNLGADLDFAISKQFSLSVRPDLTVSSAQNLYSATATLGIALN